MPYAKGTIDFNHFKYSVCACRFMFAFRNRFEYQSNTYHPDRYSNLFLNAYINRHVHVEYLKMIVPLADGIFFYIVFTPIIVSEYDQEIPQSQTADNPVAP